MPAEFPLMVMYGQIEVKAAASEIGGLLWSEDETAQGFAWTPTLVGFGVPDHDGGCSIRVDVVEAAAVVPDALWALRVPFEVPDAGVEVGTIFDTRPVPVPPRLYGLVFQALPGDRGDGGELAYRFLITFGPPREPGFAILRRGPGISADRILRERADPA